MSRYALLLASALLFTACAQDVDSTAENHGGTDVPVPASAAAHAETVGTAPTGGAVISADAAVEQAPELAGQTVRVQGEVAQVCQQMGCWLTFRTADGTPFRVSVPRGDNGYVFTFPKDVSGAHVVIEGTLEVTETDVATRRHLAEDEGRSAEEVAAITEAERTIVLNATGARIERADAPAAEPGT